MNEKPAPTIAKISKTYDRPFFSTSFQPEETVTLKPQNAFVGRQPIYTPQLDVSSYELLFHSGSDQQAGDVKKYQAMSQVLLHTFVDIGLDTLIGQKRALIGLTGGLILMDYVSMLPADRVMVKVASDALLDGVLLDAVSQLSTQGYSIVLDDFVVHDHLTLLEKSGNIVAINMATLDRATAAEQIERLRHYEVTLLATHVESQDDLQCCRHLGFDYVQGGFLCQPDLMTGRRSSSHRMALLRLLTQLQNPDIEFDEVEILIRQHVALSYSILRVINSSFYSLPRKIDTIRDAILLLGLKSVRTWATVMLLAGIDDKPQELFTTAMIRAKMCERLAQVMEQDRSETFFLVGLFSVLDALMDRPMSDVVASLPLADEVVQALLHHDGTLGTVLGCVLDYERGDWDGIVCPPLEREDILDAYLDAVVWADKMHANLVSS